jgi:hypothetical protein
VFATLVLFNATDLLGRFGIRQDWQFRIRSGIFVPLAKSLQAGEYEVHLHRVDKIGETGSQCRFLPLPWPKLKRRAFATAPRTNEVSLLDSTKAPQLKV